MIRTAILLTATSLTLAAAVPARAQVTGSGTPGYVPLWTGTTSLGTSEITSEAKRIGIGTATPTAKLEVVTSNLTPAIIAYGGSAPGGSEQTSTDGIQAFGGLADPDGGQYGGSGIVGVGGGSSELATTAGPGGYFIGGNDSGTGTSGDGLFATCERNCYAGDFKGNVRITGTLTAATKNFQIDDPLDPANRYLQHAAVESSEMKNIYDGTIMLDAQGAATVRLPSWFQAENGSFRYQLTAIGAPCPGLYVAHRIEDNRFSIAGGAPGVEVSWQVTGVRQDPYARANPLMVEPLKAAAERGSFLHPELYDAAPSRNVVFARNPAVPAAPDGAGTRAAAVPADHTVLVAR